MATATLLGVFLIPVLYVVTQRLADRWTKPRTATIPVGATEVVR
jgi:hypothetical protein